MSKDKDKKRVLVVHGPNLDRLGKREKDVYGDMSLDELKAEIAEVAQKMEVDLEQVQSNSEAELVSKINTAASSFQFIIINPGAFTHYSHAIHDAIRASNLPAIEVHISNVGARETFRRTSVISPACIGVIAGFGVFSYLMALEMAVSMMASECE